MTGNSGRVIFIALAASLVLAAGATAGPLPTLVRDNPMITGGGADLGKAAGDTIDLMGPTGSGAAYLGDFEAGWNGWTSVDLTQATTTHWQVSDYNQTVPGNLAAWCGDLDFAACNDSLDTGGGYGNSWHDQVGYRLAVANPTLSATVTVTATLQYDTEPAYDFVYLSAKHEDSLEYIDLAVWDGMGSVAVNSSTTYQPEEFIDGTDVLLLFRFTSDGGWSDADCSYYGAGACQIDDITVTTSQAGQPDVVSFTNFQDGTFGDWPATFPTGVGNFAGLWSNLHSLDPCHLNYTRQVAFIDDGIVVPGTGGSQCINWCYGPYGYIVNTTGGLAGPTAHIQVDVLSPIMTWPEESYDGLIFAFDVYRHEDLSADAPGIFYQWGIASADTDNSAGNGFQTIENQPYMDRSFVLSGGPDYVRYVEDVTDLMNPGRDVIQVRLGIYELGWAWGWTGNDGYPAPYFDNVSVKIFPRAGPGMSTRPQELAQDNFPEADTIDFADLGSLHVRFDMAANIALRTALRNDPGDSIVANIVPVRSGGVLYGLPEMHYVIQANPVFDIFRTTPSSGSVAGQPAVRFGNINPDKWAFDLPDTGTLFPGDVLHYYIRAADEADGDIRYATLPTDISGYGDFSDPLAYDSDFVVHALPSISPNAYGGFEVPPVLFWNDFGNRGGEDEWYGAFRQLGYEAGVDYDIYYTNQPSSGVGNGLGGRTAGPALAHYRSLLYAAGYLSYNTLSNGDFNNDPGDDIGALTTWLSGGNRGLLITGDNVASELVWNAGGAGTAFVADVLGVDVADSDVRHLIGNQATPQVMTTFGNPVLQRADVWLAYGGCPGLNTFDALTPRAGATRLAEFTDPNSYPGSYPYSAATLNYSNATNRIISLPYDLMDVYTPARPGKAVAPHPTRVGVLSDILVFFGIDAPGMVPSTVPVTGQFVVNQAPNPFNPRTKIQYSIDAPGHLTLKIFNVRGQLVRTLIDRRVETGGGIIWDGTDDRGQKLASGVYFREARLDTQVEIGKMLLVK